MTDKTQSEALPRYKIGYHSDEWGMRSSIPSGIPDVQGPWVRYEDAQKASVGLHACIAELEVQIEAVGAGGVHLLSQQKPFPDHAQQALEAINSGAHAVASTVEIARRRASYLRQDTDAGRAYVAQFFKAAGSNLFDDYIHGALAGDFACELASILAAPPQADPAVPSDGWLHENGLLYRLTDEKYPCNRDEISVTMADGSRSIESRSRRALELLDRIRATAPVQQAAPQPEAAPQEAPAQELSAEQVKAHGDKVSRLMARDLTRFDAACEVMAYLKEQRAPGYYTHRMSIVLHGNTEGTEAARAPDTAATPQAAPAVESDKAYGAIMGAAYDFRDAHLSGSMNQKRAAHAALDGAVRAALAAQGGA